MPDDRWWRATFENLAGGIGLLVLAAIAVAFIVALLD